MDTLLDYLISNKKDDNTKNNDTNTKKTKNTLKPKEIGKGQMFGLISGSITTIGIMVGLWQSHNDYLIIVAAILSVALSDSFSDGFGMYFSQRTYLDRAESIRIGIQTTIYKVVITLSFILPFLVFDIDTAIKINIVYGSFIISYASYIIGERIFVNLFLSLFVILMSYIGGNAVKQLINILKSKTIKTL
jgi:hypothetical protein